MSQFGPKQTFKSRWRVVRSRVKRTSVEFSEMSVRRRHALAERSKFWKSGQHHARTCSTKRNNPLTLIR
jgi:hypothetical protein